MSGYKNQVQYDAPVSFWTFDGDLFDKNVRVLLPAPGEPMYIMDEVENQNPAILQVQSIQGPHGYRLGVPSLVPLELSDQASCSFGFYGRQPTHPDEGWSKAYMTIPHSLQYAFPTFGSFSIEFIFNKKRETEYKTWWNSVYHNQYDISCIRPIMYKNNVIDIRFLFYYGEYIVITWPSGITTTLNASPYLERDTHFVLTWDVKEISVNVYEAIETVYIESRIVYQYSRTYYDVHPTTNVATDWEIAGTSRNLLPHHSDRHTSSFKIDQIAIYDYTLSVDQVANHYKKLREYDRMVVNDRAELFYPMDEDDSIVDWTIKEPEYKSQHSNIITRYVGQLTTLSRGDPGPKNIPLAVAPTFTNGALAFFRNQSSYSGYNPIFTSPTEYSVEFWFNTAHANRGILLSHQGDEYPFPGMLITLNWRDNAIDNGGIQWNLDDTLYLCSLEYDELFQPYYFNDGTWHHITLIRRVVSTPSQYNESIMVIHHYNELWLDGRLHAKKQYPEVMFSATGSIYMMSVKPGHLSMNGQLCKFAYYNFALQPQQIQNRWSYSSTYKIKGVVTLRGVPTKATIRAYDHVTGLFLQEQESDINTGEYAIILVNNRKVDLMVFDKHDLSVRYRAYGPITPSEYEDLPILI